MGGLVLAVASFPLVLAGIAELLVSELGIKRGFALLSVAFVAFAIAGNWHHDRRLEAPPLIVGFPLTSEEFTRNINWVRTVLGTVADRHAPER